MNQRIPTHELRNKIMSAEAAAKLISDEMNIVTSGFTCSGYPKSVPKALAQKTKYEEKGMRMGLYTGEPVNDGEDDELGRRDVIWKRLPYSKKVKMKHRNASEFIDVHLGHLPQMIQMKTLGEIHMAIVEVVGITEEGYLIPTTSVGCSPTYIEMAQQIIVEVNMDQPYELKDLIDVYKRPKAAEKKAIPIEQVNQRIGSPYIVCDPEKIVAIVITNGHDTGFLENVESDVYDKIGFHLGRFLEDEVNQGYLESDVVNMQIGVGVTANAVLRSMKNQWNRQVAFYSEIISDAMMELIESGQAKCASATALTFSKEEHNKWMDKIGTYGNRVVLRPQELTNHPEIIRRLGIVSINTALEVDIYGNVNSSMIMGTNIEMGIGGSGDFTRNAKLSIFITPSTAKRGCISSIVPMVSHHDHTEHDVMVVITEYGVADLRGKSPKERAVEIINNCAHPMFRKHLIDYFLRAKKGLSTHTPHILNEALSWHQRYEDYGTMQR